MKIKELETRSNLSAKTIRFYEEKGLIVSKRGENGYREFEEECVEQLKLIRLLRGFQVPLSIIQTYQSQQISLLTILEEQLHLLEQEQIKTENLLPLLHQCVSQLHLGTPLDPEPYLSTLQETMEPELIEAQQELRKLVHHSFGYYVLNTLILSGPILWLLLFFIGVPLASPGIAFVLSLLSTSLLTLLWKEYFAHRKEYQHEKLGGWKLCVLAIGSIVASLLFFFYVGRLREAVFVSTDYVLWSVPRIYEMMAFFFMIEGMCFGGVWLYQHTKNEDLAHFPALLSFMSRHRLAMVLFNLLYFYVCFFNINIVHEDSITYRRWYAPWNHTIAFSDIDHVETGFVGSLFSLTYQKKGDFYYTIHLKDGTKVDISQPYPPNEQKYLDHSYLEIEEADGYLMQAGVAKVASEDYVEYHTLAEEFKERFLTIIRKESKEKFEE